MGVIAQNAFSEHSIGQLGDILFRRFLAPPCGEIFLLVGNNNNNKKNPYKNNRDPTCWLGPLIIIIIIIGKILTKTIGIQPVGLDP